MMAALHAQPDIGARSRLILSMGGVGYAGVDNELFYRDSTMMLLAIAKKTIEALSVRKSSL